MVDLTALMPFVIGFFVLAGVATVLAVASIARVAADLRQGRAVSPVVSIAGRPTAAAVTGRAA